MPRILECNVIQPENSMLLRDRVAEALGAGHGILSLILRPEHEVPPPEDIPVSFRIQQTDHLPTRGIDRISGRQVELVEHAGGSTDVRDLNTTVSVYIDADPEQPSTASITVLD